MVQELRSSGRSFTSRLSTPCFHDISFETNIIKYLMKFSELVENTHLGRWKGLAKVLSLRDTCQLLNRLVCLSQTQESISMIHRNLLDFLWMGTHWGSADIFKAPLERGQVGSHVTMLLNATFHLQEIQRYLHTDPPTQGCTQNMSYDWQL